MYGEEVLWKIWKQDILSGFLIYIRRLKDEQTAAQMDLLQILPLTSQQQPVRYQMFYFWPGDGKLLRQELVGPDLQAVGVLDADDAAVSLRIL